ncbi:hypothetical protein ACN28S_09260 [Cystobacter fuscus]
MSPLRRLTGLLLSPGATLNDWLLGPEISSGDIDSAPPLSFVLTPGVSLMTRLEDRTATTPRLLLEAGPQVSLAAELTYGALGDPTWRYRYPFSYFDASAGLTFPGVIMANLHIRGLLLGGQYGGLTSPVKGLWGLFGLYDFGANNIVRVSSVAWAWGRRCRRGSARRCSCRAAPSWAAWGSPRRAVSASSRCSYATTTWARARRASWRRRSCAGAWGCCGCAPGTGG